jgi:transcriptional regulator with XRE-family HTH domain
MEGNMERSELNKIIGKNIRWLRKNTCMHVNGKKTKLNQSYLGKFLGIIPQQISKFEIGKNELGAMQLYKYSRFFNISTDNMYEKDLINQKYNKEVVIKDELIYQLDGKLVKHWPYAN